MAGISDGDAGGCVGGDVGRLTCTVVRMSARVITTETSGPPPLLLTVPQAARMLAISRSRVYDLIWKGELVPIHIGRSARFTVSELERFVAGRVEVAVAE